MQVENYSLQYCAYTIAVFDLLCAVLFVALSLGKICIHLSWLTIFAVCFGFFWLSLIILLIFGIYRRNTELVMYWLIFSCVGIFVEFCLIVYAFILESTFQKGLVSNSLLLCLGLFVESIFWYIVYQFYRALPCKTIVKKPSTPVCECPTPTRSMPKPEPRLSRPLRTTNQWKCNLLQSRGPDSSYTCGAKQRATSSR